MTTTAQPDFNALSPEEQRAVAERLLKIEESGWKPFWCPIPDCDGMPHLLYGPDDEPIFMPVNATQSPSGQPVGLRVYEDENDEWVEIEDDSYPEPGWTLLGRPVLDPTWAHNHARVDQRLPPWNKPWVLMILSGRGAGKTRTGIEFVTLSARKGVDGAIVGRRGTELVNTHVAEIIKHAHPEFTPVHWASKDLLEWPNGTKTYLFSAERPENIRSVNLSYCHPAGTLVRTEKGQVPIERIERGDQVWTRQGLAPVSGTAIRRAEVFEITHSRGVLRITADHPLMLESGWCEANLVRPGDMIVGWTSTLTNTPSASSGGSAGSQAGSSGKDLPGLSTEHGMSTPIGSKTPAGERSTTSTETSPTTTRAISSRSLSETTEPSMQQPSTVSPANGTTSTGLPENVTLAPSRVISVRSVGEQEVHSVGVSGNSPEFFADDVLVHNCWFDEAAWMDEIKAAWANARFAARVKSPGNPIHFLITSTPTPTEWVMKMEDDPEVIVRRVSTYANRANLDAEALAEMEREYEGTRMGRQELHGEVLRDVEGALWNDDLFKHLRVDEAGFAQLLDSMDDRVLAVDPAGSANKRSDATGIIGGGAQHFDDDGSPLAVSRFYVLGRATVKGTPTEWAEQVFKAARLMRVNRIVAEKNFGGEMVKQVLTDHARLHPETSCDEDGNEFRIEIVHAAKSKETRAEPVVGKYEKGVVCVDGEALVSTDRGLIPLRDVEVGDLTLTRSGFRRVQATWDMGIQDTLEVTTSAGVSVAMTPDHRVFTCNRGWVHACELSPTDTLVVCDEENYDPVLTVGARQGAESRSPGVAPVRPSTSGLLANVSRSALTRLIGGFGTTYKGRGTTRRVGTKEGNSSTALCGSQSEVRYQRGGMYTTETTTPATTQWTTLNRNPQENTASTTTPEGGFNAGNTTPRKQSTGRMLRGLGRLILSTSSYARNAGLRSKAERLIRESDSARPPVTHDGGIVSVRAAGAKHVYDISVEGEHEFFANGVLVHNCHVTSPTAFGDLSELEKQQTTWVPKSRGGRMPSPNDIDALVWMIKSLESKVRHRAEVATSRETMRLLKKPGARAGLPRPRRI